MTLDQVDDLRAIDWNRPWLVPWRALGEPLAAHAGQVGAIAALNAAAAAIGSAVGQPRFVAHTELPAGEAYEAFIARTACVPTRSNLHDFFNGLAWLVFPGLKRRLNQLQAIELATRGKAATRGAVRDALTLLDENGAWLQAPPVLLDALARRDWPALFVANRSAWSEAKLVVFGHALVEKLMRPRKAITAHVWALAGDTASPFETLLDDLLVPPRLETRPLSPLPLLGVPGWWAQNDSPGFYDDLAVFRPPQGKTATGRSLS